MTLGAATTAALASPVATTLLLYDVEVSDSVTWHLTSNIEAVTWQGTTYTPYPIQHDAIELGGQQDAQLNVTVSNITDTFRDALRANETRGRKVIIYEVLAEGLADTVPHNKEILWIENYQVIRFPAAVIFTLSQENNKKIPTIIVTRALVPNLPRGKTAING